MKPAWIKASLVIVIFGALIFGGFQCINSLTRDSLRASEELNRGVKNK